MMLLAITAVHMTITGGKMRISGMSATQIGQRLRQLGFSIKKVSEPDDVEDGVVEITDKVHIQVGHGYAGVVKEENGHFTFIPNRDTMDELVKDIRIHSEL